MGAINRPKLPPKAGYVESRDTEGNPTYVPTEETLDKQRVEKETLLLKAQIQFQTERADLLEGALVEIASMVVE